MALLQPKVLLNSLIGNDHPAMMIVTILYDFLNIIERKSRILVIIKGNFLFCNFLSLLPF